jgi:predicted O-methyltransferase YrrM
VDSWRYPGKVTEKDYHTFLRNIACVKDRVTILKMLTQEAVPQLPENFFDLIFIDADHSYKWVKSDIINFAPKVKPGGLLCGHDYNKNWPGVVKAVNELLTAPQKGGKALWWTRREQGWLVTQP